MHIFDFDSYISIIEEQIKLNAHVRGYKSLMAKAAKCQNSYFSLVLSHKAELSADQASALADFWELNNPEAEYFINLVLLTRASTDSLKARLKERIQSLRDYVSKYSPPKAIADVWNLKLSPEDQTFYMQHWVCPAVHALLFLPNTQTPQAIADYLSISVDFVKTIIERMTKMGLIEKDGERLIPIDRLVLTNNHSDLALLHTALQERAKFKNAIEPGDNLRYSFTGTTSLKNFEAFKIGLRELVGSQLKSMHSEEAEETLVGFCYDIFLI